MELAAALLLPLLLLRREGLSLVWLLLIIGQLLLIGLEGAALLLRQ